LIVYKIFLAWRININWDEFWYLSFVHSLKREELTLVLQGAYTHLFTWLPLVATNEADQVVAARLVMVALLGLTAWFIWLLGRRWLDGFAAAVPPFVYLSLVPVTVHGGSFRADSMLAPLLMGAMVLLARERRSRRDEVLAGALIGLGGAVTVKILLFAPMVLLFLVTGPAPRHTGAGLEPEGQRLRWIATVGLAAAGVAIVTIALHAFMISGFVSSVPTAVPAESVATFATRAAFTTILNSPLFALARVLETYVFWQPLPWLLMATGLVTALVNRQYQLATLAFALLPIAIYRNSYPYFYVVMMAPASVTAGFAVKAITDYLGGDTRKKARNAFLVALALGLGHQCLAHIGRLSQDDQAIQRQLIAGLHSIFPEPVNYIDRCGMIGSFRKVNFFMSTWGLAAYRAKGEPVMERILREANPAFVIMNTPALQTGRPRVNGLLEPDRKLLDRYYPRYWGPIRVAGGMALLGKDETGSIEVPFPDRYRVESSGPVLVDGIARRPGDQLHISGPVTVRMLSGDAPEPSVVKLFLASAQPRPELQPDPQPIFTGL
jgi:hypothetical protein